MTTRTNELMQQLTNSMNSGIYPEHVYEPIENWFNAEKESGTVAEDMTLTNYARLMTEHPEVAGRWDAFAPGLAMYLAESVRLRGLTRTMHTQWKI